MAAKVADPSEMAPDTSITTRMMQMGAGMAAETLNLI